MSILNSLEGTAQEASSKNSRMETSRWTEDLAPDLELRQVRAHLDLLEMRPQGNFPLDWADPQKNLPWSILFLKFLFLKTFLVSFGCAGQ